MDILIEKYISSNLCTHDSPWITVKHYTDDVLYIVLTSVPLQTTNNSQVKTKVTDHIPNMSAPAYYELYRRSTIGSALADALDTLISDEKIQPQLAMRILNNFDRIVSENLKAERGLCKSKLTFKGDLHTYRFCDDVWTFIIKNVLIKMTDISNNDINDSDIAVEKFKIVACNSRKAGEI